MTFRQWLQTEIELSGVDLKALGKQAGVSAGYISMLRSGKKDCPSSQFRTKVHRALSDLSPGRDVPAPPADDSKAVLPVSPSRGMLFSSEVIQMALGMIATVGGDSVSKEELDLLLKVCYQIHSRRESGGVK